MQLLLAATERIATANTCYGNELVWHQVKHLLSSHRNGFPFAPHSARPMIERRLGNTFIEAELVDAQSARTPTLKALLPIQIVIQSRTRPARFTHNLTPWKLEGECLQITKADKYGFGGRLRFSRLSGVLFEEMSFDTPRREYLMTTQLAATYGGK